MALVENLDVFLADFGVPVSFTGAPAGTVGIAGFHDVHALDADGHAEITARVFGVFLKSTVAALLTLGQSVTVGGVGYLVRDPTAEKDGAFTLVALRSPS